MSNGKLTRDYGADFVGEPGAGGGLDVGRFERQWQAEFECVIAQAFFQGVAGEL